KMHWCIFSFVLVKIFRTSLSLFSAGRCDDWGVDSSKEVRAYQGEPARLKCPLFLEYVRYNYSTAHAIGLTLMWYRTRQNQDIEEPINFRLPDNRITKEKDVLWFRPISFNDTGNYTCMLMNATYSSKVAFPVRTIEKDLNSCNSNLMKTYKEELYLEHTQEIACPDTEGFYPMNAQSSITWYSNCSSDMGPTERKLNENKLLFLIMREIYEGNYTCILTYTENNKTFNLTRTINVQVVASYRSAKPPSILNPNNQQIFTFMPGEEAVLSCRVFFSYLRNSRDEVWWTIDGVNVSDITDPRIKTNMSVEPRKLGEKIIRKALLIKGITNQELKYNYTCFANNPNGTRWSQAAVKRKALAPKYTVELACGLGMTVFIVVVSIIIYHVYWLEMVLLYRAYFGADETVGDGKEYDIYVSYARNAEEEEFVLLTLRNVLENDFGYKVCIFDRDSLPGGNIAEAVFSFIRKSRRMIMVMSPDYLNEKSLSILEFKLGVTCQHAMNTKLVVVEYKPPECSYPEIAQLRESALFVKWRGERSKRPSSKFWKALRLALPLRSLVAGAGMHESYSSHSDVSMEHSAVRKKMSKWRCDVVGPKSTNNAKTGAYCKNAKKRVRSGRHSCVRYCDGDVVREHNRGTVVPSWETHLCKPKPCGRKMNWTPASTRMDHHLSDNPCLHYRYYTDLSNNNDFYVL
uniref:Interleukin 1 receptor accessory protein n=1 Tax=Latimeria chalumnae TaxID=7897 RepID=H3B971_LATCH